MKEINVFEEKRRILLLLQTELWNSEVEIIKPLEKLFKTLESKISSLESENVKLRQTMREFIMRANYAFPMTEDDLKWWDAGRDAKTKEGAAFMLRLMEVSGIEAECKQED